jgi:predicted nucleic acid-binding protein
VKIFIDTNVLLDLILKRDRHKESLTILDAIAEQKFEAVMLDISIINIDYIAKKQSTNIRQFLHLINRYVQITGANNKDIEHALNLNKTDLEDSIQYIAANKHKCDIIITNDKKFFSENIKKLSSSSFVAKYITTKMK